MVKKQTQSFTGRTLRSINGLGCVGKNTDSDFKGLDWKWNLNTSIQQIRYGRNTAGQPIRLECFGLLVRFPSNIDCLTRAPPTEIPLWLPFGSVAPISPAWSWQNVEFSVILFVVADETPSVLAGLSLPEKRLSDCLQLRQLKTDFLEVEGPPVLDLPHGKWVHVHEGDIHQLPGEVKKKRVSGDHLICGLRCHQPKAKSPFLYLESRIVRVKYLRYLKRVVESCSFKNSSSLYLKSERAKRNMICAG